jgi:hypothetical protein
MPIRINVININNPIRNGVDVGNLKLLIIPPPLDDGELILDVAKLLVDRDNIYIYEEYITIFFQTK